MTTVLTLCEMKLTFADDKVFMLRLYHCRLPQIKDHSQSYQTADNLSFFSFFFQVL